MVTQAINGSCSSANPLSVGIINPTKRRLLHGLANGERIDADENYHPVNAAHMARVAETSIVPVYISFQLTGLLDIVSGRSVETTSLDYQQPSPVSEWCTPAKCPLYEKRRGLDALPTTFWR